MASESEDDLTKEDRLELEEEGYVVEHPDHDDIQRVEVADWSDAAARVTGLPDHYESGDGVDIPLEQFTTDGSVLELIVEGEVVLQLVHCGDGGENDDE